MVVSGMLTADRARLHLSDLDIDIDGIGDTEALSQVIEDYFSELVDLNNIKVERHRVKVSVQRTEFRYNKLYLQANLNVAPDPRQLQKALAQK